MYKELRGFKDRCIPIIFSSAVLAGILAFLSSTTATLLGGLIEEIPRTPRDEILFIIYLTPLLIWIPSIFYFSTRNWEKVNSPDKFLRRIRIYKLISLIVAGLCCSILTRIFTRLTSYSFDHELPAAGVLCLFGSFCFLELLKNYKIQKHKPSVNPSSAKIRNYLTISISFFILTVSIIVYLVSIGKIH